MELYKRIIELVDVNLIYCLIPIIVTLLLVELLFKNQFETKKVLHLVRWVIIVYTLITWTFYLIGMYQHPEQYAFINRATGPYAWSYWLLVLCALILPFTLLSKKLASKFWYVLLVAFCMKMGFYFERFVLITTSLDGDYLTENDTTVFITSILYGIGTLFIQGVVLALLTLGMFEVLKRYNNLKSK